MSFRMELANTVHVHCDVREPFTCARCLNAIDCSPFVLCEMLNYTINRLISIDGSGVMQSKSSFIVKSNKETCSRTNYNTLFWQHWLTLKPRSISWSDFSKLLIPSFHRYKRQQNCQYIIDIPLHNILLLIGLF